ncbi:MAG: c-type cytochrome [Arcobacteraceae bacterium]
MFKKSILSLFVASSLFGEITMCYKENFTTPSKLENTSLDGGECNSKYSSNDMRKNGWKIKDISTSKAENGMNYTYIFSKESASEIQTTPLIKNETLKSQLLVLENERLEKEKSDKEINELGNGKKIYESQCVRCHGANGELKPNTSGKLAGLNSDDFMDMMRDYGINQRDNGAAILMAPYSLITKDRKEVVKYLESINVLKKSKENKESK